MTQLVIDPVCGMRIDPADAVATATHDGETAHFCSTACRDAFLRDPETMAHDHRPDPPLTEAELAERGGVGVDRVRTLVGLGILQPEAGTFSRSDVMRVRVATDLEAIGFEPEALSQAVAAGHLRLGYLESAGRRQPRSEQTFTEVASELGVPVEALQRIYVAFGLPRPDGREQVRAEDLAAVRGLAVLLGAGVEVADVLRMARVWGDATRRVAQYLPHYFHGVVEARFRERGLRDNEAYEAAISEVGLRLGQSGEDLLTWLFRRHSDVFLAAHQFEHVEAALVEAGVRRRPARADEAAVFADLSGYTRLTEEAGDAVAAEMALELAQLASEVTARHGGSTVKLLGDGALLHFRDPDDAVRASLDIVDAVAGRGLPPAHVSVNAGPILYDQGDYFGRTVNVAARIGALAQGGQVLVGEVLAGQGAHDGFRLEEAGSFELKGIEHPVRVFRAIRTPS
jgi:adenylate cyclase